MASTKAGGLGERYTCLATFGEIQRCCVIPSTGFYEWMKMDGKTKCKYQFNAPDSPVLYMAGIYTDSPSRAEDEIIAERFVILQTLLCGEMI